ncbi:hypothetical protein [Actinomadura sediminis]
MLDPATAALRWFPLVARSRPRCLPLDVRISGLCAQADAAARDQDPAAASTVFNQAALLASDVGLHDLARDWCHQHAAAYLRAVPLDAASARRALEPFVNIARLHIRAGNGDAALQLLNDLTKAVTSRTDTIIDGQPLPGSSLTSSPRDHAQLRQWLWTVNLADGTRALTTAGRWNVALDHLHKHNGIGQRMLDGRQVAVIARILSNDRAMAQQLLAQTAPGMPWENAVTACLAVLGSSRVAQDSSALLQHCQALDCPSDLVVFNTRLCLFALGLLRNTEHPIGVLVDNTVQRAIDARDGYAAREVLANDTCVASIASRQVNDLSRIIEDCGLKGCDAPRVFRVALSKALAISRSVILAHGKSVVIETDLDFSDGFG